MIRTRIATDVSTSDLVNALLDQQPEVIQATGQQVYDRYAPEMLAALEVEPGPAKHPIEWTSDKQRKFVMAMLSEKGTLPYQRSHKLAQAWTVEYQVDNGVFIIRTQNSEPAAKFVYGSLAKNRNAAVRFKQQFHSNTGWQTAVDTVDYWNAIMIDAFKAYYGDALAVARRGYTSSARKR